MSDEEGLKSNSGEQEADMEEEDEEIEEISNKEKENEENIKNIVYKKPRSYYTSIISQLESELESKIKINNNNSGKALIEKEYEELQLDLNRRKSMLEKLKKTNEKQKNAIEELSAKIEKENEKRTIENNTKLRLKKINIEINPVLKEKDNKLNKATKEMKLLRLENEGLRKILYEDNQYNERVDLEDLNRDIKEKLDEKNNEIYLLMKQLKAHIICKEEQKKLNHDIITLNKELKNIKINIQEYKDKTEDLIFEKNEKYRIRNLKNLMNNQPMYTTKKLIIVNKSTPNIHSNKNKSFIKQINNKDIILPLITPSNNQNESSILSEEFCTKLKQACTQNKVDYDILVKKIKALESKRKNTENKNKNELNEINSRVSTLDEKYKLLNIDKKGLDFNNCILKNKLSSLMNQNYKQSKKVNKLEKELKQKQDIFNSKNNEISLLLEKINSIRNIADFNKEIEIQENEINKYINRIKKEKILKPKGEENKRAETNDDVKIKTKKTIYTNEESIQSDVLNTKSTKDKKMKKTIKKNS